MNKVKLKDITKRYNGDTIVENLSLSFEDKGLYIIQGESGSGKTTLLDIISGVDNDYTGDCFINGVSLKKMNEDERSLFRLKNIGYLRQKPEFLELDTVLDNVSLIPKSLNMEGKTIKRKALDLLNAFGIESKSKQTVNTLSGGERSRVSFASILMLDPTLIIADEPTGGLDKENAVFVFEKLKALSANKLVIVVTHDKNLASKYADIILTLKGKKIIEKTLDNDEEKDIPIIKTDKKQDKFSFFGWLSHSKKVLKKKKWRSTLSTSLLSFALFSLGLSIYVKDDLENRLSESFTSITGKNAMIVQKRNVNEATFGKVIASSEESVKRIRDSYCEDVLDYGVTYLADFENYFPEENNSYILIKDKEVMIPSMSVRTFNDYLWLDSLEDIYVYPERPSTMERSQVVIGLPYSDMANICFNLGIMRSYQNLGDYLEYKPLELMLRMQNDSWLYTDEQLFSVVGVVESQIPTIYHLDHMFNEYVLEERMRFPSSDEHDTSLPWILQKVFYIEPSIKKSEFIRKTREDSLLNDYVFECCSYDYDKTNEKENEATSKNRLYVYLADKRSLSKSLLKNIANDPRISSYSMFGEHSYAMYPESLAMGFRNPFFISSSLDDSETLADSLSRVKEEDALGRVSVPDSTIQGSFLIPQNSSLTFSSDFVNLKEGRKPEDLNEICVSKGIINKLGKSSTFFLTGMISSYYEGGYLYRNYRTSEVKVVGVVEEEKPVIYGDEYWNVDFWREKLGMSSFLLEPTSAIFYLKDGSYSRSLIKRWSAEYPTYKFTDPSLTIKDSLDQVMSYLSIVLSFASILSLSLGFVLFLTVSILTSVEQKSEGRVLHYLGFPRMEITNSYITSSALIVSRSLILSILSIGVTEVMVDKAIQASFGVNLGFAFSLKPIFLTLIVGLMGLFVVSLYMHSWIKKRCFLFEKR
ncbi:MAG: ABC transporter ATP-binding protein [Bacilli bacterium]|nr:ABC transporter ATP-binding protein [Bacilli bacterium]